MYCFLRSNHSLDLAAVGKTLLTPRQLLNAFSDPRQSWTWELMEASKSWLPILLLVAYTKRNLTYTTRQGSRIKFLAQTCLAVVVAYHHEVASKPLGDVSRESCSVSPKGDSLMSCTPLPKAAKPVWANELTLLLCLVINVKFQFGWTTKSTMGSQLLLASISSQVQLWLWSDKAFNECLVVSNVLHLATLVQTVVTLAY